jgi:hypothetical protein
MERTPPDAASVAPSPAAGKSAVTLRVRAWHHSNSPHVVIRRPTPWRLVVLLMVVALGTGLAVGAYMSARPVTGLLVARVQKGRLEMHLRLSDGVVSGTAMFRVARRSAPGLQGVYIVQGSATGDEVALVLREPGRSEAAATLTGTMLQRDELRAALADPDGPSARAGQIFLAPVFYRQ